MNSVTKPTRTRSQIRRAALIMTAAMWVLATMTMLWANGQPFQTSAVLGAVGALGGLVAWVVYHTISRRNDGLAAFIMSVVVTTSPGSNFRGEVPLAKALTPSIIAIVALVIFHAAIGYLFQLKQNSAGPQNDPPLWDAQVDPPPSL